MTEIIGAVIIAGSILASAWWLGGCIGAAAEYIIENAFEDEEGEGEFTFTPDKKPRRVK